jgi:hypothetical protein
MNLSRHYQPSTESGTPSTKSSAVILIFQLKSKNFSRKGKNPVVEREVPSDKPDKNLRFIRSRGLNRNGELPVYELVVAGGGSTVKLSDDQSPPVQGSTPPDRTPEGLPRLTRAH